jgi:hypothetical protein
MCTTVSEQAGRGYTPGTAVTLLGTLLPPLRRKGVIRKSGARSVANNRHYLLEAASMFPSVVLREIRRNTSWRVFFLEACGAVYSLTAGAFGPKLEFLRGLSDLPRLLVPVVAALSVFLLRDAWSGSRERRHYASFADMVLAGAAVILTQIILSIFRPDWLLHWAPTQGGFVGWAFLTVVRSAFPPGPENRRAAVGDEPFLEYEIPWKYAELGDRVRRRNTLATIVGLIAISAFFAILIHSATVRVRVGCIAVILFAVCMMVGMATVGWPGRTIPLNSPAHYQSLYRQELTRQYRLLIGVWFGYAGLILPACVLLLVGTHVYEFVALIYLLLLAELILRQAEWFQRELCRLRRISREDIQWVIA